MAATHTGKHIVGWREWVALPSLGVTAIKAKLDTGARTSALHAFELSPFDRGGAPWLRFRVHPVQRSREHETICTAPLLGQRIVTNPGGRRERRFVIEATVRVGTDEWPIELTLTDRDEMGFRLLIGRSAMRGHVVVDPSLSYQSRRARRRRR